MQIGFVPGFISDHSYMQEPGQESDSFLLERNRHRPGQRSRLVHAVRRLSGRAATDPRQPGGERSSHGHRVQLGLYNPGKQTTSLVNGLFVANSLGSLLDSGYSGACIWDLRNDYDTGNNNSNALVRLAAGRRLWSARRGLSIDAALHGPLYRLSRLLRLAIGLEDHRAWRTGCVGHEQLQRS